MMKKIVSLLVVLALFASTAFAAPVSVAASLPEPTQTVTPSADLDALFADVNAVPLTDIEAQAVEGDGPVGAVIGAIAGVVIVVKNPYVPKSPSRDNTAAKVVYVVGTIAATTVAGAKLIPF